MSGGRLPVAARSGISDARQATLLTCGLGAHGGADPLARDVLAGNPASGLVQHSPFFEGMAGTRHIRVQDTVNSPEDAI